MNNPHSKKFNTARIWFAGLNSALGNFIYSYNMSVFTSSQPSVSATLGWGEDKNKIIAIVTSLNPLGSLIGSLLAGYLSKFIGHRQNIIIADLIVIFATIMTVIPSTYSFSVGRFLSGIGSGCFCMLCPLYLNELSPAEISGRIGSLMMILSCIGSTLAFGLALILPTENYELDPINNFWIVMFSIQGIMALVQVLFFSSFFKKESPFWLLSKGLIEESLDSLKFTYKPEYAQEIMDQVQKKEQNVYKDTWKALKIGIFMNVLQQLSGINAILSYTTTLFYELGSDVFTARVFTMLTGFVRLLASLSNIKIIDYFGRKKTLVYGTLGLSVCLALMGILSVYKTYYLIPILLIQVYLAIFVMSSGPICWIYCGEVLSSQGMSICSSINFLSNFIIVLIFPFIKELIGYSYTFFSLSLFNILGAFYLFYHMIETKGMLKAEIRSLFSKENLD